MIYLIATYTDSGDSDEIKGVRLFDTDKLNIKDYGLDIIIKGLSQGIIIENVKLNDTKDGLVGIGGNLNRYPKLNKEGILRHKALTVVGKIDNNKWMAVNCYGVCDIITSDKIQVKKDLEISNGKVVGNIIQSISGEYKSIDTTKKATNLERLKIINSKYDNKLFRTDGIYKIILGTYASSYNNAKKYYDIYADIKLNLVTRTIEHECDRNLSLGYVLKSRCYTVNETDSRKFMKMNKEVVNVIKFDSSSKEYVVYKGGTIKNISLNEMVKLVNSNKYILDCEVKELEDAVMIKTYFEELYFNKNYIDGIVNQLKKQTLLKNKSALIDGGEYKIDSDGMLVSFRRSERSNVCRVNDVIKIMGRDPFKIDEKIELIITNDKLKFKKLPFLANLETLEAPDNILIKMNSRKTLKNCTKIDKIRLNKNNTFDGYKCALNIVDSVNRLEGVINEELATNIIKEKLIRLKDVIDRYTQMGCQIDCLKQPYMDIIEIRNALERLGQKDIVDKVINEYGNRIRKSGIILTINELIAGDVLIAVGVNDKDNYKVPDEVKIINSGSLRVTNVENIDFNNTEVIKSFGVTISNASNIDLNKVKVLEERAIKIVGSFKNIKMDNVKVIEKEGITNNQMSSAKKILDSIPEDIEYLDCELMSVVDTDNKFRNTIIEIKQSDNVKIKFNGDKSDVPNIMLDNLKEFEFTYCEPLRFITEIKNKKYLSCTYDLERLVRLSKKVSLIGIEHVDSYILNVTDSNKDRVYILSNDTIYLHGKELYFKNILILDTNKIETNGVRSNGVGSKKVLVLTERTVNNLDKNIETIGKLIGSRGVIVVPFGMGDIIKECFKKGVFSIEVKEDDIKKYYNV